MTFYGHHGRVFPKILSTRWSGLFSVAMEGSILELLERHGSLAYEQVAALLSKPRMPC